MGEDGQRVGSGFVVMYNAIVLLIQGAAGIILDASL